MIPFVCEANRSITFINLAHVVSMEICGRGSNKYLQLWGNEERDWEIHDADDIERLLNLLKVSVVDRRRMGWE